MMGLLGDKKNIAAAIMSEMRMPEEKKVPEGLEADFSKACEKCASDVIEGVKAGDPRMVSRALRQFFAMSEREEEYSEPSEG